MTDVRPKESTVDGTGHDRPYDPEFREPTEVDPPRHMGFRDTDSPNPDPSPDPSPDAASRDIAETSGMREVPGARAAIGVVDHPPTEPVDYSNPPNVDEPVPGPRADDLSEGELSERELGEREANEPAPTRLPDTAQDEWPTGAAEAPEAANGVPTTEAVPNTDDVTVPDVEPDVEPVAVEADDDAENSSTGPAPGDLELAPVAALWPGDSADGFRERWREIQLRFVDEPKAAAEQADDLVEEAVAALTTSLQRVRAELGQWRSAGAEDSGETEHLRVAVQRYREFLDTVVAL